MTARIVRTRSCRPLLFAATAALSFASGVQAQLLDLSRVPLIVNTSVPPNIMVTLDDSGSMGFAYLPDTASFGSTDCRFYDSASNALYFNPDAEYPPPLRADGTPFPNASSTAAWRDGFQTSLGTENLETAYRASNNHNGYQDYSSGWYTNFPTGVTSSGQRRGFYCRGGAVRLLRDEPANWQKFANWFSYYRTRSLAARTALSTAFARLDPGARVAWQNYHTNQITATTQIQELSNATWRTNFFNWLYAPRFSGDTPMLAAFHRAGQFFQRSGTGATNPYWDTTRGRELSCRQNFQVFMTDGYWNVTSSGTGIGNADAAGTGLPSTAPDPTALSGAEARVYWNVANGGTAAPNLADMAMYYWGRDLRGTLENNVPSYTRDQSILPVVGATSNDREIFFNPANDPADWQRLVNFMITFGAGGTIPFDNDIPGQTQADRLRELRQGTRTWPAAVSNGATTIDDAWHAAVNSRGEFLSANDPQQLVNALTSILDSISNRNGVGGAAAASSTVLNTDRTQRFVGTYDTRGWSGDLLAYNVLPNGEICPDGSLDCPALASWRAQPQLNTRNPSDRVILTSRAPSGAAGVPFRWTDISAAQRTWLSINPQTGLPDTNGERRLNFVRGDRTQEQSNGGPLRNRQHVLGAIVESNTVYVSAPSAGYNYTSAFPEGGTYADFVAANKNRRSTVYVGANDGMLHAFDAGIPDDPNTGGNEFVAGTGRELFAYVPYEVSRNLNRLSAIDYAFVPTVDGTPVVKDVYIGGRWRTVLLSNLRGGGQGVFALDITNPAVSETAAGSVVLWEFTDDDVLNDTTRLGYTYGRPNFARLNDGTWVAVIPGGYNNESTIDYATRFLTNPGADTRVGNGRASLFIVNLMSGALIREIVLPTTARGLAEPVIGDYEGDFVDDVAIMGDIAGNIWRVDLINWSVDRLFQPQTVNARPITARPRLFADPITQGFTVVVGTGKFVEQGDRTTTLPQRQVIMGVRDLGRASPRYPATIGNMVQQTFSGLSGGFFQMASPQQVLPSQGGWYIQLGNTSLSPLLAGERVIEAAQAYFQPGYALFQSFIPTDDPCQTRAMGALYAFAASDGAWTVPGGGAAAALASGTVTGGGVGGGQNAFDTTGDGRVDAGDRADAVGRFDPNRPPNAAAALTPPGGGSSASGGIPSSVWRRRGWREIDE